MGETLPPRIDPTAAGFRVTFPDASALLVEHVRRDSRRRLWAEVTAFDAAGQPLHMAQPDLLDQRQCTEFHGIAASTNGTVDWMARLLFAKQHYLASGEPMGSGPDVAPTAAATPSVEPFPTDVLPQPLAVFIREGAAALPCPPDFLGVPMFAVLGTAIGNTRVLEIKPGWREGARIYSAVVASPGTRKSPALDVVTKPLSVRQQHFNAAYLIAKEDYRQVLGRYEIEAAAWSQAVRKGTARGDERPIEPDAPQMGQAFTTDATLEALAALLAYTPRGIAFVRDELTAWVLSMNQYKGGKGADRQHWLSFWNGAPVIVNRKLLKEPIVLERPFVCVTGCLPPDVLGDLADERGREDGFIHRLLFAYPEEMAPYWTDACISDAATQAYVSLVQRLWTLQGTASVDGKSLTPQIVSLTPKGRTTFVQFANELHAEMAAPDFPAQLRGPYSKLEGYCARLALILQACRQACGETDKSNVEAPSVVAAASLVHYFKSHARRVYAQLRTTPEDKLVIQALEWIRRHGGHTTTRELLRANMVGIKTANEALRLLQTLEERGYGMLKDGEKHSVTFLMST